MSKILEKVVVVYCSCTAIWCFMVDLVKFPICKALRVRESAVFQEFPECSQRILVNRSQQKRLSVSSLHFQRHNSGDEVVLESTAL